VTGPWEFWIDCGGTFTDAIGRAPGGTLRTAKVRSGEHAPVAAIQRIWSDAGVDPCDPPPCRVALGTTVATNALLERAGEPVALIANRGLSDVWSIGTQQRPDLFALAIDKPEPLHGFAIEAKGRIGSDGARSEEHDDAALDGALAEARARGFRSIAAVSLHAYRDPTDERRWAERARAAGFPFVVASHEIAPEVGLLARGETALADAYLTPLLRRHVEALAAALPRARLRFMQSSGGITDAARFRGPNGLLSGPAGGAVATAAIARAAGERLAIGFDMGGTSTDVTLIRDGAPERALETEIAGLRLRAPMLRIHTVAAGGGSLCRFDGFTQSVGPESAGADPGPLCYAHRASGGTADGLTLSDVNHFLGRLPSDRFPLPLVREPVVVALEALQREMLRMPSRRIWMHPLAGVLSALGIGLAERSWDGVRDAGGARIDRGGDAPEEVTALLRALEAEGRAALALEGADPATLRCERRLDLRTVGTETPIDVTEPSDGDWLAAFAAAHRARYGYERRARS
jgi:5-oxoprolinase (ATP-hydrolysing)